ncbi:MAG: hypothetical protein H7287_13045 [Thermoleophilia bacterium]|nr:hypothetical protein [Thermoleophilia bacterium]
MSAAPDLDAALEELIALANDVRIELIVGTDFDASLTARNRYNDAFARFQGMVTGGAVLGPEHLTLAGRLDQLHSANMERVAELKQLARTELGNARRFQRISGYAPDGADARPAARFIDDAA